MTVAVQQAIVTDLGTATNTQLAQRIFPIVIPEGIDLPAASYVIADGIAPTYYVGSTGLTEYSVTLNVYSRSYMTNQQVVDLIETRYHATSFTMAGNIQVQQSIVDTVLNAVDPDDPGLFRSTITFSLTV